MAIIFLLSAYILARVMRSRNAEPKYIPTKALKNRWRRWASISNRDRGHYSEHLDVDSDLPSLRPSPRSRVGSAVPSRSASPALEQLRTNDRSRSREPSRTRLDVTIGASVEGVFNNATAVQSPVTRGTPADNQAAVDRHTSVRSIMTLPAYSMSAGDHEQVLGREGERGGIDTIIDMPETVDEEEQRRDNEMESLYQIRRQRRAEAAEREERRQRRRDARARGDWAEVERLRVEAREIQESRERELTGSDPANGQRSAARLIAEYQENQQNRERQRRVSSAQYASVGVVRHDGSRVRASSNASARSDMERPLLDSAADMGDTASARRGTLSTLDTISMHQRNRSTSSVFSISDIGTDDEDNGSIYHPPFAPPLGAEHRRGRSRGNSNLSTNTSPDFEVVSLHSNAPERGETPRPQSRTGSTSRLSQSVSAIDLPRTSGDEGDESHEREPSSAVSEPPNYEHLAATEFGPAPDYSSPTAQRAPHLPGISRLPSIRVEEAMSPVQRPDQANEMEGASIDQQLQR